MSRSKKAEALRRWCPGLCLGGALLAGLVVLGAHSPAMEAIRRVIAMVTSGILNLLGHSTFVVGTTVQSHLFGIRVVAACTGVFLTGLYLVAVAVLPTRWTVKLIGAGIGLGVLFVANLARLVSLYYLGVYWPTVLDAAHQLVWQSLLIAVAVAVWLWWAGRWAYADASR